MNEARFTQEVEEIFAAIEDAVDESEAELDCESGNGILTLDCEDTDTQVIITRQVGNLEIWVAAKSGGFHCAFNEDHWHCRNTDESLNDLLDRVLSEQSNQPVVLGWTV